MSLTHFSAFAATLILLNQFASGQQPSLTQIEQGLQPAPGAAPGPTSGYLGAELDDVGEDNRGVRVKAVRPNTPAEASGLKANDLIVGIDGKKISNLDDYDSVAQRPVGAKMVFTVDRAGKQQSLAVTLGTRSATATVGDQPPSTAPTLSPPGAAPSLSPAPGSSGLGLQPPSTLPAPSTLDSSPRSGGITAQPLDARPPGPDTGSPQSLPSLPSTSGSGNASLGITVLPSDQARASSARRRGAYIAGVKPGSPAALAGLPTGGVIVQVDGRPINSDDDLIATIRASRPGQEVELTYYDGSDRLGKKMVRLAEAGAPPSTSIPGTGGFAAPGGGFGGGAVPGTTMPPADTSPRSGPGGGTRPLLNRVERMAENIGRGTGLVPNAPLTTTTVYDPLAMAALQRTVAELTAAVNSLEERLRAIEGRTGGTSSGTPSSPLGAPSPLSTPSSPSFGSPQTPGFSAPQPSITPGFGAPTAPSGTNP